MRAINSILGAMCFTGGILMMGSPTWMPWSQVVGALVFLGTTYFARRL